MAVGVSQDRTVAWRIHHRAETASTNLDARAGEPGDVFTADFQTAGRGRLDHRWLSPSGANLMMSVVLDVDGLKPDVAATVPLVVGLAVADAVSALLGSAGSPATVALKWPNDVYADGRKICGILCERDGDRVIAGIGVNVAQRDFAPEIRARAVSMALLASTAPSVAAVRDAVLAHLARRYACWCRGGLPAVLGDIRAIDFLRGRTVSVRQTDGDAAPVTGLCGGIRSDGSLDVSGHPVYAGEAHVEDIL